MPVLHPLIISCLLAIQIFDAGDVDEGAASGVFCDAVSINIQPDFNFVLFHESHVVVGDVECLPVRHADAKRFEWLNVHEFFQLHGGEHIF